MIRTSLARFHVFYRLIASIPVPRENLLALFKVIEVVADMYEVFLGYGVS